MTKDKDKPKRGRPPLKMPDPIPDTLDNVLRALLSNRTSEEKGGVDLPEREWPVQAVRRPLVTHVYNSLINRVCKS